MSTNQDWLALSVEETLAPHLPIIDPHHHLWEFRPDGVSPRYLMDEFQADLGAGHNIVATVFIECGTMYKNDGPEGLRSVATRAGTSESARVDDEPAAGGLRVVKMEGRLIEWPQQALEQRIQWLEDEQPP